MGLVATMLHIFCLPCLLKLLSLFSLTLLLEVLFVIFKKLNRKKKKKKKFEPVNCVVETGCWVMQYAIASDHSLLFENHIYQLMLGNFKKLSELLISLDN